MCLKELESSK